MAEIKSSSSSSSSSTSSSSAASSSSVHAWWESPNPSKREGERFQLLYSFYWIPLMAGIVITEAYKTFQAHHYMVVGLVTGVPLFFFPFFFSAGPTDAKLAPKDRYLAKASIWLAGLSFVGNYFWTHYFYQLLGAVYLMPSIRLNNVPIPLYFITFAYFSTYHCISNISLRICDKLTNKSLLARTVLILVLSYIIAFMEAWTLENYPDYTFKDRTAMYTMGSGFYAIYFIVSFPMFFLLDEDEKTSKSIRNKWTLWDVFADSMGACMMVTILLDFWKLIIGPIFQDPSASVAGAPWI